jgi:hypothetical protein
MDLPDTKKLAKFIKLMRKEGVNHLKCGDFELSLDHTALFPQKPIKESQSDHIPVENSFTEDDALYWSSAGIPEAN